MAGRALIFAFIALTLVVAVAVVVAISTSSGPDPIASLEDLREREVLFFDEHHIYLVYNDGDPLALSDDPQHMDGEYAEWCTSSQMFETPTHGEKFDRLGQYYSGPAMRGLDRYPLRLEGDGIFIDLEHPIQGPERGEAPISEPEGDLCVPG